MQTPPVLQPSSSGSPLWGWEGAGGPGAPHRLWPSAPRGHLGPGISGGGLPRHPVRGEGLGCCGGSGLPQAPSLASTLPCVCSWRGCACRSPRRATPQPCARQRQRWREQNRCCTSAQIPPRPLHSTHVCCLLVATPGHAGLPHPRGHEATSARCLLLLFLSFSHSVAALIGTSISTCAPSLPHQPRDSAWAIPRREVGARWVPAHQGCQWPYGLVWGCRL